MNVGERYTLFWKAPHRIECEIISLEHDGVKVEAVHRCPITCYLVQMRQTLPLEGPLTFSYADFTKLFLPLNRDAIALPPA